MPSAGVKYRRIEKREFGEVIRKEAPEQTPAPAPVRDLDEFSAEDAQVSRQGADAMTFHVRRCEDCPMVRIRGDRLRSESWCAAEHGWPVMFVTATDTPPRWCPLRTGPIQITLAKEPTT